MYEIMKKVELYPTVTWMDIHAPDVARHAKPGQFVILRVDENGERIPLTIGSADKQAGTITIIFQHVGATTIRLGQKNVGDSLADFVGPLGEASHLDGLKKVAVIGGGLGTAIAYPQAKALYEMGAHVDVIIGFRNQDLVILDELLGEYSTRLFVMTDDGSNGHKGFVTTALQQLLDDGNEYDAVIAIGPLVMMKAVAEMTRPAGINTIVSMNSIMIDGTGMCGCCRLTVGGKTKFACVDGPDFDAHLVDFDEAIRRSRMYVNEERESMDHHDCNLFKGVR